MIARWPRRVPAGKESSAPWYFADFMPTAAGLAGLTPPSCDGRDVLPLLTGRQSEFPTRILYWESPGKQLEQAVRFDRWRGYCAGLDGALELYDLASDP
jgi:arylsulfatase A-like enzyme